MYQQPGSYPPPQIIMTTPPSTGLATASTVFGIIGLVTSCCSFGLPSLLAIVLGHMANGKIKSQGLGGKGSATAGLIMGYIVLAPAIVFSAWLIFMGGLGVLGIATTPDPSVSTTLSSVVSPG